MQAYRRKRKFNPAQFLVIAYFTVIVIGTFLLMLPIATTGEGAWISWMLFLLPVQLPVLQA